MSNDSTKIRVPSALVDLWHSCRHHLDALAALAEAAVAGLRKRIMQAFYIRSATDTVIVEGVFSTFFYHIARSDSRESALCRARTIPTRLHRGTWGKRTYLNERYCENCKAIEMSLKAEKY